MLCKKLYLYWNADVDADADANTNADAEMSMPQFPNGHWDWFEFIQNCVEC